MWWILVGLIAGAIAGISLPWSLPVELARYTAVGIVGILDSVLGALRAELEGKYDKIIFSSGVIFNIALGMGITFLGDKLNLDLYLAVLVAFTIRLFTNIGIIRTTVLKRFIKEKARQ